jgi:hypothetical protein
MSSNSIPSTNTSYSEVTMRKGMKGVIILHHLNKYFIQWGHNKKRCERCHRTLSTLYILHTGRSQWEKVWKVSSYSIPSINTSYSEVTMRKGMKGIIVLDPLNKYFIQWGHNEQRYERCHHTASPQLILYTMRSQWAEVWKMSLYSILSINTSYNEFTSRDVKDVIVLHPLNKYFIQWSHNEKKVWKMSSYSIPSINTSYNEVTMRKDVEDVNTFIWCSSVSSLILFYIIPRIVNSSLKNIIMHVLFVIDICHMYFLVSIL